MCGQPEAITRPSKPIPLGMQTANTADGRFSGIGAYYCAVPKPADPAPDTRHRIVSIFHDQSARHTARRCSSRLLLFLRSDHHDHLAPFHFRHLLDLTDFVEVRAQALKHAHTDFLVSHFAATETQRDFRLVAVVEEANKVTQLDVVVAVISARRNLTSLTWTIFCLSLASCCFFASEYLNLP